MLSISKKCLSFRMLSSMTYGTVYMFSFGIKIGLRLHKVRLHVNYYALLCELKRERKMKRNGMNKYIRNKAT